MRYSMTFDKVERKEKVSGICKKCGKRRIRTVSVFQTVNPFNKNKEGFVKNRFDIYKEITTSLAKQVNELKNNFICASCS